MLSRVRQNWAGVEERDRVCHVSESGERIELNIVITFFIDNFFLQVFVRGVETLVCVECLF